MNLLILTLALITIIGAKFYRGGYREDYLDIRQTSAINGIFVILVFMRHFGQYIEKSASNALFFRIDSLLGQFIVVTFLFYSGYGIMYSIEHKAGVYVNRKFGQPLIEN